MTIRRMRITCWILKSINIYSEYEILIAFLLQQWLYERASMLLYTNIACPLVSKIKFRCLTCANFLTINSLNAELNPICHLLVLLRYLTFMGPCIVSIFQYTCISNKMQRYTVYLYLETALHAFLMMGGSTTRNM
jgi:hypothetical protein